MIQLIKNKVTITVALFFLISTVNAQSKPSFSWGNINADFDQIAPGMFYTVMSVQESIIKQNLKSPFYIYNKDMISNFNRVEVVYYNSKKNGTLWRLTMDSSKYTIHPENYNSLFSNTGVGDAYTFDVTTSTGDHYNIRLEVPGSDITYSPQFYLLRQGLSQRFPYQLLTLYDGHKVLKLDTTLAPSKRLLEGYKSVPNVAIQHIIGFSSTQNFINESDSVIEVIKNRIRIHPVRKLDFSILKNAEEPAELLEKEAVLRWSTMYASPTGPTFSMRYARNQVQHSMVMEIDDKLYQIKGMRLTFYNRKGMHDTYYITDSMQEIITVFNQQLEPFSVIIDRLVFDDPAMGREVYIPQVFMFNFE